MQQTISDPPTPGSVNDLSLSRERDLARVNTFLNSHHPLGGVEGWHAAFAARYDDSIVALVVLGRPKARHSDDGDTTEINRFARRDDRPANTGSWLIARARDWARLEGYERLLTHAGVAGNQGTVYEALGFEHVRTTRADGSGWTNREQRETREDYERRTYEYRFEDPL